MKLANTIIQYVGLTKLNPTHQMALKSFAEKYQPKYQMQLKKPCSLKVAVKMHEKDGKRKKFSIIASTVYAGKMYNAKGFDYTFNTATQMAFKNLEMEIKKAVHSDEQKPGKEIIRRRKPYTKSKKK